MSRYERQVLAISEDGSVAVDGRIVAVLDSPRAGKKQITALVETAETDAPTEFSGSETVAKTTFFCNELKDDGGRCSREVDEPEDTCWQHPVGE